MIYLLDFRAKSSGGAVLPGRIINPSNSPVALGTAADLVNETQVTFLTHGFNVNRDKGMNSLLEFASTLPATPGTALVAMLWPGDHWLRKASYPLEGRYADDSAAELEKFIRGPGNLGHGVPVSFVCHSLGARVVMETIDRLSGGPHPVEQVCLMAAAIDAHSLAAIKKYNAATIASDRVAVLASRKDTVLKWVYPAGDVLQKFLFFWREEFGLALGYRGPKKRRKQPVPQNVLHEQIKKSRESKHGHYLPGPNPSNEEARNRASAAQFAREVLDGTGGPEYR